MPETNTKSRIN